MTAMAGMFLSGNAVFSSLAMGTMLVVAVAVLGSVTVLPASALLPSAMKLLGERNWYLPTWIRSRHLPHQHSPPARVGP